MPKTLTKLAVAIDGSPGATRAVVFAGRIASAANMQVALVHVYDSTVISIMGLNALTGKEIDDAISRVSQSFFETSRDLLPQNIDVEQVLRMGHPAKELVAYAEESRPDLLVMGSRGQSNFKQFIVGSVSHQVIQHAPCPVTVVR